MADLVFNPGLGATRRYADLVLAGTGVLKVVILKTAEADATLRTRATLAAVKAAAGTAEADWTGGTAYARKELDATGDGLAVAIGATQVDVDASDLTWLNAGVSTTPMQLSDLLFCYAPTSGATDANIVPLTCHDYPEIANGADITATLAATGFYRAAG